MGWQIIQGDARHVPLSDSAVQCVVTSPPYWGLRDYGIAGQLGNEPTPDDYVKSMVQVLKEVWRVLKDDGVVFLNLGDSFCGAGYSNHANTGGAQRQDGGAQKHRLSSMCGLKPKDLIGIPWRVALALQADGWYLRSDIIWHKPNPMPESVRDRPTKSHEYVFLLTKNERYYYDADAIKEPAITKDKRKPYGRGQVDARGNGHDRGGGSPRSTDASMKNVRSVWTITTEPFSGAHFATFPTALVERCILAGCPVGGIVFDPFCGAGTTLLVANRLGRHGIGLELNPEYCQLATDRINRAQFPLLEFTPTPPTPEGILSV